MCTGAAERAARGQKFRNRPANPLTCRASDVLCLDANAAERPWFLRISAQKQKNRLTDQVHRPEAEFHLIRGHGLSSHAEVARGCSLLRRVLFAACGEAISPSQPAGGSLIETTPLQSDNAAPAAQFVHHSGNAASDRRRGLLTLKVSVRAPDWLRRSISRTVIAAASSWRRISFFARPAG